MRSLTPEDPSSMSNRPGKRPRLEEPNEVASLETEATLDIEHSIRPDNSAGLKTTRIKHRKRKQKQPDPEPYSSDDVVYHDVTALLQKSGKIVEEDKAWNAPLPIGTELELVASELSSTGSSSVTS
jgi:tRNA (uracil-5-)-methyltransferase